MFKSKFLKSFFIILAILIIGGGSYAVWKKNTDIKKVKKEEFVCSSQNVLRCEVERLLWKTLPSPLVAPNGSVFSASWEKSVYDTEDQLVSMGESIVPILIEIIKETDNDNPELKDYRDTAIYILGQIKSEESKEFLKSIFLSDKEDYPSKHWARLKLMEYSSDPKILKILNSTAGDFK